MHVGSATEQLTEQHICTVALDPDFFTGTLASQSSLISLFPTPQSSFKQHKKEALKILTFHILKPVQTLNIYIFRYLITNFLPIKVVNAATQRNFPFLALLRP